MKKTKNNPSAGIPSADENPPKMVKERIYTPTPIGKTYGLAIGFLKLFFLLVVFSPFILSAGLSLLAALKNQMPDARPLFFFCGYFVSLLTFWLLLTLNSKDHD